MDTVWVVNARGRRTQVPAGWWRERRPALLRKGWQESRDAANRLFRPAGRNRILPAPPAPVLTAVTDALREIKPLLAHVMPWPLSVGGAQRMIHEWCGHCGHHWRTVVIAPGGERVFAFPGAEVFADASAGQAADLLRRLAPEVVVHHGPQFEYGRYVPVSGVLFWVIHGEYVLRSLRPAWGEPVAVFANSPSRATHDSWPALRILPLGVDLQRFRPGVVRQEPPLVAGVIGRLSMEKLPLGFLTALKGWAPGAWRLRFIGKGRWNPWVERVRREIGSLPFVEFQGDVSPADMPGEYRRLDAVLVPSEEETGSYALVEAMASGLPVVARAVGGIPFTSDGAAILGRTDWQLLDALRSLDSAAAREFWGRRAREMAVRRHDGAWHAEAQHAAFAAALPPWISIVCPVRDTPADYLRQMWESVRRQTMVRWELILVDDGSRNEATLSVLAEIAGDPRARLIRFPMPRGISAALNAGIEIGRAAWIARMDGDDVMTADRLERQWVYLADHPEVDVLGGQLVHWDGRSFGDATAHPPVIDDETVRRGNWFLNHPTVLIRKEKWREVGGYDTSLPVAEDLDLWLRLWRAGATMRNLREVVLWYRTHPGQATRRGNVGDWVKRIRDRWNGECARAENRA
ncbi:MAG: glycosyltransferase [Myxococcales bacterium]|nr:glycosyltransferase [Myxococcales bacterium]